MPSPFPSLAPERRGLVHRMWHVSAALATNPHGDPAGRDLYVITPPNYAGEALPLVLALAPFAGTGASLLARGLSEAPLSDRLDQLWAEGMPPCIVALPDGMTRLGGSQYLDSPGMGLYGTWLADEVIPFVQAAFPSTGRVGVIGRSSGGFGGLHLALTRPGRVHAVGASAPDLGFDLAYLGDIGPALSGLDRAGGPARFLDWFWRQERPSHDAFAALNLLAMSCCYSPDPSNASLPCRLPFDPETGAINHEVLASWRRFDPIVQADSEQGAEALRALSLLWIEAGDRDEYQLHRGAKRLSEVLVRRGVPHEHVSFPGGHRGTSYRYDTLFPAVVRALVG